MINLSKPNVWLNPYSITKDSVEKFCFMYVNEFDAKIAIVKMFNVYGPRQAYADVKKAIPAWITNALKGQPVEIFGEGNSTMDLIFIRDVVDAMIVLVDQFDKCRIQRHSDAARNVYSNFAAYNEHILELGSGREITVNSAVKELEKALGFTVNVHHSLMRSGEVDGTRLCADISRLSALTGFRPQVPLNQGLKETIEYYKGHLDRRPAGDD